MTANRRGGQHVPKTNVVEIANELARRVGEGEGVAPEEPLEGCHPRSHHREPDERQRRFPPCEAGVEKAIIEERLG